MNLEGLVCTILAVAVSMSMLMVGFRALLGFVIGFAFLGLMLWLLSRSEE